MCRVGDELQLTGTLGDVMKESASAALSYTRARANALGLEREFLRSRDIHVHIPAGATPKDGPSAGIAIASAIVSALTSIPLRGTVAMTGEITLRGRVLPIGGLKEKSVAALRNRITDVIVPLENVRDIDDLPKEVKAGIRFHPVQSMDQVLALALAQPVVAREEMAAMAGHTLSADPLVIKSLEFLGADGNRRRLAPERRTCPRLRSRDVPTSGSRRCSTSLFAARRSRA